MYTKAQLGRYLDHIGYQRTIQGHAENTLGFLAKLQKRNLARVPFEIISLHYSKHRLLSLDPVDLFEKIVTNSPGGYCMEVNTFLALSCAVSNSLSLASEQESGGRMGTRAGT
jgi:arylamine N-acetyltransferase